MSVKTKRESVPVSFFDILAAEVEATLPYYDRCPKHGVLLAPGEECAVCFTSRFGKRGKA